MSSFLDTLGRLGPARLGVMGAIIFGLFLFFIFISMRVSTPSMTLLYSDLAPGDAGAISARLQENEIPFEVSPDGTRVMVAQNEVGQARMLLAQDGLPNGGSMGYEIFDNQSGFGTTNLVQNMNRVRALEGELARTIGALDSVRSARVHLVLPQRELFTRDNRPSTASVFLNINAGRNVSREQIVAIQSLVSSAVPDLKANSVAIIDSNGNLLARGGDEDVNLMSLKAEEMRRSYEAQLTQKIEDQVSRIVGYGNVRANVTAEMNFDRISTNEELFDPETQVVRSSQVTEETSSESEPGPEEVSIENNLPGVGQDLLGGGASSQNNRIEEVTNFEISKTVRSTVREVGEITRLSVAVLVDGSYTESGEGEETTTAYQPRSEEEMERIRSLVQTAVGFDETRGDSLEVVNMQFAETADEAGEFDDGTILGFERSQLLDIVEIITLGVMLILVVLLVLRPMVNKLLTMEVTPRGPEGGDQDLLAASTPKPALSGPAGSSPMAQAALPEESMIDIQGVEGKVKASSVRQIEEIIENYPNEAVSVIRSWMTQES